MRTGEELSRIIIGLRMLWFIKLSYGLVMWADTTLTANFVCVCNIKSNPDVVEEQS